MIHCISTRQGYSTPWIPWIHRCQGLKGPLPPVCSTKDGPLNGVHTPGGGQGLLHTGVWMNLQSGVFTLICRGPLPYWTKPGAGREEESAGKRVLIVVGENPGLWVKVVLRRSKNTYSSRRCRWEWWEELRVCLAVLTVFRVGPWGGYSSAMQMQAVVVDSYFLSEEANLMAESESEGNVRCLGWTKQNQHSCICLNIYVFTEGRGQCLTINSRRSLKAEARTRTWSKKRKQCSLRTEYYRAGTVALGRKEGYSFVARQQLNLETNTET